MDVFFTCKYEEDPILNEANRIGRCGGGKIDFALL